MKKELHQKIESYLNGTISIDDLEVWLVSNLQGILDSGDDEIIEIANQIDADLVELREEILSMEDLYDHLQSHLGQLETISVDISTPGVVAVSTETSTAIAQIFVTTEADPPAVVDHHWPLKVVAA